MNPRSGIGLDACGLSEAFPFHFALAPDGTVRQVGASLARLTGIAIGDAAKDHLRIHRPRLDLDFASLQASAPGFLVLQLLRTGVLWRGQTLASSGHLLFLGSPWFTEASEMTAAGLSIGDFAAHDAIVDYLTLLQTKRTALHDAEQLANHLRVARHQLEAQLDETQRVRIRLEALVNNMPWGVLVEDEAGKVALTNTQFCTIFAVPAPPHALIGMDCAASAAAAAPMFVDERAFLDGIQRCLEDGRPHLGMTLMTRDGRVLERDYVPIVDAHGGRGNLWQYRDVTARHAANKELEDARLRAESANAAKSEFLAMMSHEMRTPLGVIVGLAELLRGQVPETMRQDFLRRLEINSRSLLQLIESTLDFARLENRQLLLSPTPFEPRALAESVATSLVSEAGTHGQRILVHIEPDVPGVAIADAARIRQILINLLGNAVKFSDGPEILLAVATARTPDGQPALAWSVTDGGPGIPAERHDRIFERFVRFDDSRAARGSGTGLGLAICRELCAAMHGTLTLDSEPGRGSCFTATIPSPTFAAPPMTEPRFAPLRFVIVSESAWLCGATSNLARELGVGQVEVHPHLAADFAAGSGTVILWDLDEPIPESFPDAVVLRLLPNDSGALDQKPTGLVLLPPLDRTHLRNALLRLVDPTASAEVAGAPATVAATAGRLILVVDDDDDSRTVAMHLLQHGGHRVDTASSIGEALQRLQEHTYDLLLTDLRMPDGGGLLLLERLRQTEAEALRPRLPAIVVSADTLPRQRQAARRSGADDYTTKPIEPRRLLRLVDRYADNRPLLLVVDDDEDLRALHCLHLRTLSSVRVVPAASAEQALALVRQQQVAVALVDVELPGMSGLELAAQLRRAGCPRVALVTGHDVATVRESAEQAGCVDVLQKPMAGNALVQRVQPWLPR